MKPSPSASLLISAMLAMTLGVSACSPPSQSDGNATGPRWGARGPTSPTPSFVPTPPLSTVTPAPIPALTTAPSVAPPATPPAGSVDSNSDEERTPHLPAAPYLATGWTGSRYFESTIQLAGSTQPALRQVGFLDADTAESFVRSLRPDGTRISDAATVGELVLERPARGQWLAGPRGPYESALAEPGQAPPPASSAVTRAPRHAVEFDEAMTVQLPPDAVQGGLDSLATGTYDQALAFDRGSPVQWTRWWRGGQLVAEEFSASVTNGGSQPVEVIQASAFLDLPTDAGIAALAETLGDTGLEEAATAASARVAASARPASSKTDAAPELGLGRLGGIGSVAVPAAYIRPASAAALGLRPLGMLAVTAGLRGGLARPFLLTALGAGVLYALLQSDLGPVISQALTGVLESAVTGLDSALEGIAPQVEGHSRDRPTSGTVSPAEPDLSPSVPRLPAPRAPPSAPEPDSDCTGRAAAVATELHAKAKALRTALGWKRKGNVAAYSACIDLTFREDVAASGEASREGSVNLPPNPVFTPHPVRPEDDNTRETDSERKLLEKVYLESEDTSRGVLFLFSEREYCDSCIGIIEQFKAARPGIRLVPIGYHPTDE